MATRMQQRRGTAAQWTSANPILAAGEIGFESDNNRFKIGDGVNHWADLDYFSNASALEDLIDGAPDALNTLNELAAAIGDAANFSELVDGAITNAVIGAGEYTDNEIQAHNQLTINVHGIPDTSALVVQSQLSAATTDAEEFATQEVVTHNQSTLNVHGIANTGELETQAGAQLKANTAADAAEEAAVEAAATAADSKIETHSLVTLNVHGIADTSLIVLDADLSAHNDATLNVHGIADTADLITSSVLDLHTDATQNVHGISDTSELATLTGTETLTNKTLNDPTILVGAGLGNITITNTELGYLDGVTSNIQTQLNDTNTAIATAKAEAIAEVTAVVDSAPNALNTLNELAAALGDDENFASTITTSLSGKVASYTPIINKTASYELSSLDERDSLIEVQSQSATTITIPADSTKDFPVGTSLDILQTASGQVTIAGAQGVVVNATPGLKLRTQWSSATLFKRAANTWVVYGDLSA